MSVKQTAGRDALGAFAPKFAELNDDVLFGQVWNRTDKLSLRDRSLVTVTALMAQGLVDSSFRYHLTTARQNGITKEEIAEILTHAAFYAGWPKAWAAFNMAKEVWAEDAAPVQDAMQAHAASMVFPIGAPNDGYAQYFTGQSYLAPLSTAQVGIYNVTFEPGCRNNWHIHHADEGGGRDVESDDERADFAAPSGKQLLEEAQERLDAAIARHLPDVMKADAEFMDGLKKVAGQVDTLEDFELALADRLSPQIGATAFSSLLESCMAQAAGYGAAAVNAEAGDA